jgi:hypothetical protein
VKRYDLRRAALPLCSLLLSACATPGPETNAADSQFKEEVRAGVEEIYVARTVRTQYTSGATPACSAAPFASASEQHYDVWSMSLNVSDGRIANSHEKRLGEFTGCFGRPGSDGTFPMYFMGTHGTIPYTLLGSCRFMQAKPPAPTLLVLNCAGDLSGLPEPYTGGYLTSSSLAPTGGANAVHVPGYLSTSVVTMRFWKRR